jgi:SAM-dependent methyltransferase
VRTEHFCLRRCDRRLEVSHWLKPEQLDADLGGLLDDELFAPGWLNGASVFKRVFIGVARSTGNDPLQSWITFYDNTSTRIHEHWQLPQRDPRHSWIAERAVMWRRALQLVPAGEVLDLGSCLGFLPLLLAEHARNTVTAADISSGAMRLLAAVAARRKTPLRTLVCDAASVPLPDDAVDTVTVIHLLEQLDDKEGNDILREAVRLARRRVVVAVGFDEEAATACGHVRSFSRDKLTEMGLHTGKRFDAEEFHGSWLVVHVS